MRYIVIVLFCCGSLLAQIEEERIFTNANITEAYSKMRNSFPESYYIPQSIESMKNTTQAFDSEDSEIYGYKDLKVQWHNENAVTISLNAFSNGGGKKSALIGVMCYL